MAGWNHKKFRRTYREEKLQVRHMGGQQEAGPRHQKADDRAEWPNPALVAQLRF